MDGKIATENCVALWIVLWHYLESVAGSSFILAVCYYSGFLALKMSVARKEIMTLKYVTLSLCVYMTFYHIIDSFSVFSDCRICIVQFRYVGKRSISRYAWSGLNNKKYVSNLRVNHIHITHIYMNHNCDIVLPAIVSSEPDLYISLNGSCVFKISSGIKISTVANNTSLFVCVV